MLEYFIHPVLYAPIIGSILMCIQASLIGVLVFVRKQSLVGETLSHASYPGALFAIMAAVLMLEVNEDQLSVFILSGAFLSSFLGLFFLSFLKKRFRVTSDASLTFVLSTFFGMGILLASWIQRVSPKEYRLAQTYLFGQAATMTDTHLYIYALFLGLVIAVIILLFKELKLVAFDQVYAKTMRLPTIFLELTIYCLMVLGIVIGMKSVGVVLISSMLIAPAASARQFTNRLKYMFPIAAFFGILSGYFGNVLSYELSTSDLSHRFSLPTGPMIVLVASCITILSILFAPKRGMVIRFIRIGLFKLNCQEENLLKAIWRLYSSNSTFLQSADSLVSTQSFNTLNRNFSCKSLQRHVGIHSFILYYLLNSLKKKQWLQKEGQKNWSLTHLGEKKALHIIRLHRLWELYLVKMVGVSKERVHMSAEEMEHIMDEKVETDLRELLNDPLFDPHDKPIPQ